MNESHLAHHGSKQFTALIHSTLIRRLISCFLPRFSRCGHLTEDRIIWNGPTTCCWDTLVSFTDPWNGTALLLHFEQ